MRYHPDYGTLHPETGKQAKLAMPVKKISLYDCFIRRQNPQRAGKQFLSKCLIKESKDKKCGAAWTIIRLLIIVMINLGPELNWATQKMNINSDTFRMKIWNPKKQLQSIIIRH